MNFDEKSIVINLKPIFPALPRVEDKTKLDIRYALISPYAYTHIYWDSKNNEVVYELEEPILNAEEEENLEKIETSMREAININVLTEKTEDAMIEYIDKTSELLISELNLKISQESYKKIFYYLFRDFIGLNEIESLMKDFFIEDIECNGVNTPVYIIHRLYRNMRTNIIFRDVDYLASFVEKLAQRCGRYISYASPLLDGSLPDGSRINATYTTDITSRGPTFSVRKFTKIPWTPIQLIALNTLSPEMLAYFWLLIQYKCNILITGGTASGKTTLLNAIAFFIPPEARIVSIEDTREINLAKENWLPSVARTAIGTGKVGEVDLFALLRNSFRQNPDYVVVGEVRGKEAFVLFQGMASLPGYENILVLNSNERKMIPIEKVNAEKCRGVCINPLTEKSEIQQIQALIRHPSRNKLIKIKTETGREVIVTPDHSLFTYNDGNIIPIEVKNLKKDDCIIIPSKLPVSYNNISFLDLTSCLPNIRIFSPEYIKKAVGVLGYEKASELIGVKSISGYYSNFKRALPSSLKAEKFKLLMKESGIKYNIEKIKVKFLKKSKSYNAKFKITPEFLRFLGYYISEGSINTSGRNNRIALYAKDKKIINDMIMCIKSVGCEPKRRITKGFGIATELSFSHKVMLEFLLTHCGKGSSNKKIPDFIFGLSKEKIGEFLSALYLGDGSITKNTINYYTSSKKLTNDLTYLLLGFGIMGRILKRGKSKIGKHENYTVKIYRADEKRKFLEYVKIDNKNLLDKISKIKSKINKNKKGDIYIDKIKSIESIKLSKPIPVYDISVPGKENFIGGFGGIMLHNSGHASIATMHADSVDTVIKRLETPPIELSPTLVNTLDAVSIMSHAIVKKQQTRKLRSIVEIVNVSPDGVALTNTPFIWSPRDDKFYFKKDSKIFEKISSRYGLTKEEIMKEFELRTKLLFEMFKRKIFGFERVQKEINEYYKNPKAVLAKYGISA